MDPFIFRKKCGENVYVFEILMQKDSSQVVCGYAIVNVKTEVYHITHDAMSQLSHIMEEEETSKKEVMGKALYKKYYGDERQTSEERVIKMLLEEAKQVDRVFSNFTDE